MGQPRATAHPSRRHSWDGIPKSRSTVKCQAAPAGTFMAQWEFTRTAAATKAAILYGLCLLGQYAAPIIKGIDTALTGRRVAHVDRPSSIEAGALLTELLTVRARRTNPPDADRLRDARHAVPPVSQY